MMMRMMSQHLPLFFFFCLFSLGTLTCVWTCTGLVSWWVWVDVLLFVVWWRLDVGKRMGGRVGLRMLRGRHVASLFGINEDAEDAISKRLSVSTAGVFWVVGRTWRLGWHGCPIISIVRVHVRVGVVVSPERETAKAGGTSNRRTSPIMLVVVPYPRRSSTSGRITLEVNILFNKSNVTFVVPSSELDRFRNRLLRHSIRQRKREWGWRGRSDRRRRVCRMNGGGRRPV